MNVAYDERASTRLPGAFVWRRVGDGTPSRILPDGCIDLLWDGETITIAGPDTTAHVFDEPGGNVLHGLRFAPGWAPATIGVPAAELRDQRIALDAVWSSAAVRRMADRLATSADPGRVLELVGAAPDDRALLDAIAARARRGDAVDDIARDVGFSARQLRRRCVDAFGYGPKLLARIFRMRRALELAEAGTPLAHVAAAAGYADQPHLARDVRDLAGVPIGALLPRPHAPVAQGAAASGAAREGAARGGAAGDRSGQVVDGSKAKRSTVEPSGSCTTA